MAPLTVGYRAGTGPLHRWDARLKLLLLAAATFALVRAGPYGLLAGTAVLVLLLRPAGLGAAALARGLRPFLLFLLLVALVQACLGEGRPLVEGLPPTHEGLARAGLTSWRLLVVLVAGLVFLATTSLRATRAAGSWYLGWLPGGAGRRLALAGALVVRFLPLVLEHSREVGMAVRARLGARRRSPWRRIRVHALPLVRGTLARADELALALAARGAEAGRPTPLPPPPAAELAATLLVSCALVAAAVA